MNELARVDIDGLKVGDVVGYCKHPNFGWNRAFRYPIVSKRTVERITPKRTKFVLSGGIELDRMEAKRLVIYNKEAEEQSEIAKIFSDLDNMQYKIEEAKRNGIYVFASKVTDEELVEYHKMLKSVYDKYLNRE